VELPNDETFINPLPDCVETKLVLLKVRFPENFWFLFGERLQERMEP
jgi:hypothetical protein